MGKKLLIIGYNLRFSNLEQRSLVSGEIKNANYLLNSLKDIFDLEVLSIDLYPEKNIDNKIKTIPKSNAKGVFRWIKEASIINKIIDSLDYDIIYLTIPSYLPFLRIKKNAQIVITAHGTYWPELLADLRYEKSFVKKILQLINGVFQLFIDKASFKKADLAHSVSDFQVKEMTQVYRTKSKIFSLRNTSSIPLELKIERTHDFLWIGRLAKKKNIKLFRDFLNRLDNHKSIVVGGNDYFSIDQESICIFQELDSHPNIETLQNISESELSKIYGKCRILIVTSTGYESIPTVIFEALSAGIQVLAPNSWGIPEIQSENLILYNEGDLNDLWVKYNSIPMNNNRLAKFPKWESVAKEFTNHIEK